MLLPDKLEKDEVPGGVRAAGRGRDREPLRGRAEGGEEARPAQQVRAVFVAPTFSHLPWYADHPTKTEIRQEAYFLEGGGAVHRQDYPVRAEAEGRLLLGFSKSGWGAWSLAAAAPEPSSARPPRGTPR